jgi:hypothetical protein
MRPDPESERTPGRLSIQPQVLSFTFEATIGHIDGIVEGDTLSPNLGHAARTW